MRSSTEASTSRSCATGERSPSSSQRVGGVAGTSRTGKRRAARFDFVEDVVRTLDVGDDDIAIAEAHAQLLVAFRSRGGPRGAHDLIIAARALATDREVVSAGSPAPFAIYPESELAPLGRVEPLAPWRPSVVRHQGDPIGRYGRCSRSGVHLGGARHQNQQSWSRGSRS